MMTKERPVQFGVVGAGRIARNALAPAVHAVAEAGLVAAASRDHDRAAALNPTRVYTDYGQLLADDDVEAVIITTHNGLHHPLTLQALERGKHVLCEKPLACNAREAEEMVAAAQQNGRVLVEAFMYRHDPRFDALLEHIRAGAVGAVRTVVARFGFHMPDDNHDVRWNAAWGGGGALDVGCYCVNAACAVFGEAPRRVLATGAFHPKHDVDTALHGVLDFGDGRAALITCGLDRAIQQHLTVIGDQGWCAAPDPFLSRDRAITTQRGERRTIDTFESVNAYERQIRDFCHAVRGVKPPHVPPTDAVANMRVLDALLTSARGGGAAVDL